MRILEESAQTDNTGKIVNGMNGLNLADMTFHEVNNWKEQEIVKPHCSILQVIVLDWNLIAPVQEIVSN